MVDTCTHTHTRRVWEWVDCWRTPHRIQIKPSRCKQFHISVSVLSLFAFGALLLGCHRRVVRISRNILQNDGISKRGYILFYANELSRFIKRLIQNRAEPELPFHHTQWAKNTEETEKCLPIVIFFNFFFWCSFIKKPNVRNFGQNNLVQFCIRYETQVNFFIRCCCHFRMFLTKEKKST